MVKIKLIKLDKGLDFQAQYMKYISLERCAKIMNYKNTDDKRRSLIAELLIKTTVNESLQIPVEKVRISYNPYGKPYIDNVRYFKFNISHSGDFVAIAESKYKVGIDVEYIKDIDMLAESLKRYGQISPILISKKNILIAGERRLEAARHLGWRTINALISESSGELERLELEVEENIQRRDFTREEAADAVKKINQLRNPGFFRRILNAIIRFFKWLFRIEDI